MSETSQHNHQEMIQQQLDTEILANRRLVARKISKYLITALIPISSLVGVIWLLSPQYHQLLVFILLLIELFSVTALYKVFERRNQDRLWSYLFILSFIILLFIVSIILPSVFYGAAIAYILIFVLGYQLLGDVPSRGLIVLSIISFGTDYLLLEFVTRDWFPALDANITLILGLSMGTISIALCTSLIRPVLVGNEKQFRQVYTANLDLERRAEIEQEQRDQLQQANQEIETRATSEQEQREQLQHLVTQVQSLISNLNSAAAEIQASTTQQTASATEQDATVTQTVATVEELRTTVNQAAERANAVSGASQDALEVSRIGQNSVTESIKGMKRIRDQVESIAENILILSKQTQQIGEIINTVNGLSEQSKLLALNASIEAARAGEEGKGFAVVAMEVRQLAEQSRQATERVRGILSEIQQATNTAVMVTEEGSKGAEQGMSLVEQAGSAIQELTITIEGAAQSAMQIAASSQQQSNGMEQLMTAMSQIKLATSQTAASTRQTEQSITNLVQLAQDLETTASVYRLPNGVSGDHDA